MGLETVDLWEDMSVKRQGNQGMTGLCYLNGLGIKLQTLLLVGEELLNILALVSLKLNHLSHLSINDDGAIASYCYLLVFADARK
jgi:hypothetical protein